MKTRWKLSAAVAAGAVLALPLLPGVKAQAETITFGTNPGTQAVYTLGPTHDFQGYTFSSQQGELATSGNGDPIDPDLTNSVSLIGYHTVDVITMSKVGGGAFNLDSIDFKGYHGATSNGNGAIAVSWVNSDGTGGLSAFFVKNNAWKTDLLSLKDITSISWLPMGDINNPNPALDQVYFVWADNVVVSSTPIPAALPLFVSALGVLGFAKRRQGKRA